MMRTCEYAHANCCRILGSSLRPLRRAVSTRSQNSRSDSSHGVRSISLPSTCCPCDPSNRNSNRASSPESVRIGRISTQLSCKGTSTRDTPSRVRQSTIAASARSALATHVFTPVTRKSLPRASARVSTEARSEPWSGSEKARQYTSVGPRLGAGFQLAEGHVSVESGLFGQAKHAFADDVVLDFV